MSRVYKYIAKAEGHTPARVILGIPAGVVFTDELLEDIVLKGTALEKKYNTVIGALIAEEGLWDLAINLSGSGQRQVAFRSSWGLEWAYNLNPSEIEKRKDIFLRHLLDSQNESVNRVFSKMLFDMMRRGAVSLTDDEAERVAEKAFDLLINEDTPPAVKVWQIELLKEMIPRMDWIEENLTAIVTAISEDPECSPAMAAHARHYFRDLRRLHSRRK